MHFKTMQVGDDLREHISYSSHSVPLTICIDHFDDYLRNEWSPHWHDEFEFAIVIKGKAEYTIYDGTKQILTKELCEGDGIFINTGCLHSARGTTPGTVVAGFVFPLAFFDIKHFETIYRQNIRPIINSGIPNLFLNATDQKDQLLLSGIEELCSLTEQETGYELHCIELVFKIWRLLTARVLHDKKEMFSLISNNTQEERLKELLSFIHAHFSERISIDDMVKSVGISRTECFRCFHSILKKSPTEYLTEYRLSMATMLLANTNQAISDISFSCGFNSVSYFGKLFKDQTGLSPKKYRDKVSFKN